MSFRYAYLVDSLEYNRDAVAKAMIGDLHPVCVTVFESPHGVQAVRRALLQLPLVRFWSLESHLRMSGNIMTSRICFNTSSSSFS